MYGFKIASITALSFVLVAPVCAQSIGGTSPMDLNTISSAGLSAHIGNLSIARQSGRRVGSQGSPGLIASPGAQVSNARFPYPASASVRERTLREFTARLRRSNPNAASAVEKDFQRPEIRGSFDQAIRPYGLSSNDVADVMTVFLVSGWEIVNHGDSTAPQVKAVRRQVAAKLAQDPRMKNSGSRAAIAEELKILTTLIGGGATAAAREGRGPAYAAQTARIYATQFGSDLRGWRLTSTGFVTGE